MSDIGRNLPIRIGNHKAGPRTPPIHSPTPRPIASAVHPSHICAEHRSFPARCL